jgi:hypothetical protein
LSAKRKEKKLSRLALHMLLKEDAAMALKTHPERLVAPGLTHSLLHEEASLCGFLKLLAGRA